MNMKTYRLAKWTGLSSFVITAYMSAYDCAELQYTI